MNNAIFVVKITESPVYIIHRDCQNIEIDVQFASPRQKNSKNKLKLFLWGDCQKDFLRYYKEDEEKYFIIEGNLTLKGYQDSENEVKIIAKKIHPVMLT
uniref:Uncharacterized protein n=1 Tax=Pseudochorda nagaii TaxID=74379 RepID=A0A8F0JXI1_9PHAE|nr:hypothetical protein [Pseudochorda nagaii]